MSGLVVMFEREVAGLVHMVARPSIIRWPDLFTSGQPGALGGKAGTVRGHASKVVVMQAVHI